MTVAYEVMDEVGILLGDSSHVRWPLSELRLWINAALREIPVHKPNATIRNLVVGLQVGSKQVLPANTIAMLRVVRNVGGFVAAEQGRGAIITVPREIMDSQHPSWHNSNVYPASKNVIHAVHDPANQREYYVWPPNDGTGRIEITVTRIPNHVPRGDPPNLRGSYTGVLDIDAVYVNAITDYVLYRAYLKDAGFAGNAQRAAAHYQAFGNALGVKLQMELAANPNTTPESSGVVT